MKTWKEEKSRKEKRGKSKMIMWKTEKIEEMKNRKKDKR